MLYSYLTSGFLSDFDAEENINKVSLTAKIEKYSLTNLYEIYEALKCIHVRDKFELFLNINGTTKTIDNTEESTLEELTSFYTGMEYEDELLIKITLKITKNNVNNHISIYSLKYFTSYLNTASLKNVIQTINQHHNGYLCFEVDENIDTFGSDSIQFISMETAKEEAKKEPKQDRKQKLKLISEHVNTDFKVNLLPNDFNVTVPFDSQALSNFFKEACSLLSLMYITNVSTIHLDGTISFKINGYKSLDCKNFSVNSIRDDYLLLNDIVIWGYEGGSCSDKIEMIRNVLSIHTEDGHLVLSDAVLEAMHSNYKIYLQKDIQSYLEVKNKITEMMIESTTKAHALVDDVLSAVKNNLFVIITFILTVLLVNGFKDIGIKNIFSDVYFAVVTLICLLSLGWLWISAHMSKKSYKAQSDSIKKIINVNYKSVLMPSEISACIDPVIDENIDYLRKQTNQYLTLGSLLLVAFFLLYLIFNIIFSEDTKTSQDSASKSPAITINTTKTPTSTLTTMPPSTTKTSASITTITPSVAKSP